MKLYLAGTYTSGCYVGGTLYQRMTPQERLHCESAEHLLDSYHYIHKEAKVRQIRESQRKDKVFLDSGAFSAFTKGATIDLPGYCEYIKRNEDIIEKSDGVLMASVLDGIGDPLKTWQNQKAMESLGVRPLPCFHYGEDERYLEEYVKNYEYITLGGMVPISTPQLFLWLDRIWDRYLTDGSGRPRLKVHGFGLTAIPLMQRYPWYSVDSSSWVQIASVGSVILPRGKVVCLSSKSPSRKVAGQHLDNLPEELSQPVVEELESYGLDVAKARDHYVPRWVFNIWSYSQIGKAIPDHSFKADQPLLF